ncbi:MAG TPA: C1 family peptidase [Bacteroidales bacterium]|nr:C1 family peptidase [Bacteroidales bacterium]
MGEELISQFRRSILTDFQREYSTKLQTKIETLFIESAGIVNEQKQTLFDLSELKDESATEVVWNKLISEETKILNVISDAIDSISNVRDDLALNEVQLTEIGESINIIVLLPTYKTRESVWLSYLLKVIFPQLGITNYNYFVFGVLPELDKDYKSNENEYLCRCFACLTECNEILNEKMDLINSFTLLSDKNEDNTAVENYSELIPLLKELFLFVFYNESPFNHNRQSPIPVYREKRAFFSALGLSAVVYKRDRLLEQFVHNIIVKVFEQFLEINRKPINREGFYIEADQLIKNLAWEKKESLFEGPEAYQSFSNTYNLSANSISNLSTDLMLKSLNANKEEHESYNGYYGGTYLNRVLLEKDKSLNKTKEKIVETIANYLKEGSQGFSKALALLFLLMGKEDDSVFEGNSHVEPADLLYIKAKVAEYYCSFLTESELIPILDFKNKEKELKRKIEQAEKLRCKIENLENNIYNFQEVKEDLSKQTGELLYFTISGQKVNITGIKKEEEPIPDTMKAYIPEITDKPLPSIVDLRPYLTPVENQLQVGSCVANACVGAYEYLVKRATSKNKDFSRLFAYYNARNTDGTGNVTDEGAIQSNCIKSMMELGVCLESTWGYNVDKVNTRPDVKCYEEATNYRVIDAEYFGIDIDLMKKCLSEGFPIIIGLNLYNSFQAVGNKGIVPLPDETEEQAENHGRHAMLCVGYSDADKYFIVRNSWGTGWGDAGYCYIPYEYMGNSNFHTGSIVFLVKALTDLDFKKIDFTKNIAKEKGSLFNFSYDLLELQHSKEKYFAIKQELENLVPEFENLQRRLIDQRELVLDYQFREEVELNQIKELGKSQEEIISEILNKDQLLNTLNDRKSELKQKRKRFILRRFIVVPIVIVLFAVLAYVVVGKFLSGVWLISFALILPILLISVLSVFFIVYGIVNYIALKRKIINELNKLQEQILQEEEIRRSFIEKLINNYNQYFEVKRTNKLFELLLDFISDVNDYLNISKDKLLQWLVILKQQKEKSEKFLTDNEITDNGATILQYACTTNDILNLVNRVDTLKEFYNDGKRPLHEFVLDNNGRIMNDEGIDIFKGAAISFAQGKTEYELMKGFNILDFVFKSEFISKVFKTIDMTHDLKTNVKMYALYSKPFIKVTSKYDTISIDHSIELLWPDIEDHSFDKIRDIVESIYAIKPKIFKYSNSTESALIFIQILTFFPAYAVESLEKAARVFLKLPPAERNKYFIKPKFGAQSYMPELDNELH